VDVKFRPPSVVIDPVPARRPRGFAKALRRDVWRAQQSLADNLSTLGADWRNMMRRLRKAHVDYVVLPVGGPLLCGREADAMSGENGHRMTARPVPSHAL